MLYHSEGFELEREYWKVWDKIRYKKVDELYEITEKLIKIFSNHIKDGLLFHRDYEEIQYLFRKMKMKNFFYQSKSAKEIIQAANPKFKDVFKRRECVRDLRCKFVDDVYEGILEKDKIYQSLTYNGASYEININGKIRCVGSINFERIT